MKHDREIDSALQSFARVLCEHVGFGKTLGVLEVADDTGVSDGTIENYCKGKTTPDLEWALRFANVYGQRFPSIVHAAWSALLARTVLSVSLRPSADLLAMDANGDGKVCGADSRILVARAHSTGSKYQEKSEIADADRVRSSPEAEELAALRAEQQRSLDAADAVDQSIRLSAG